MELKLFRDTASAYGGRREIRLELPVETEILIPDYLPAVFKIVKCMITPAILQNNVEGNHWKGEGYLRCTVYYQSDEAGSRLYRTEQKFPFEKMAELPALEYAAGAAQIEGKTEYCNCRAISEHRIDLHGAYALSVCVCAVERLELLTALADCGIEQRREVVETSVLVANEDKIITTESKIALPGAGESILDIGGSYVAGEQNVQTGQFACRGTLKVQACFCLPGSDDLQTIQKDIPTEQTLMLDAVMPEDHCYTWGEIIGCTLQENDTDDTDAALAVTWRLHVEVWRQQQYMAVADAYSTVCDTELTQQGARMIAALPELEQAVTVSVEDDLPDNEITVRGCFVRDTALELQEQGTAVHLAGKGTAHLLCADARGELSCLDKAFHWEMKGDWPGTAEEYLLHSCVSIGKVTSRKIENRVRVEIELQIAGVLFGTKLHTVTTEVSLGEMLPDKKEGPALYLYFAAPGEQFFDIAKRYHARVGELLAANHIDASAEETPQESTSKAVCLLIPSAL